MSTPCVPCLPIDCSFPSDLDLYSLDGVRFFTNSRLTFVLDCPPGYDCHNFPVPWTILPGTLPPIYVPPGIPGSGFPLRVKACNGQWVVGYIPAGATPAQINQVISRMFQQLGLLQAQCDAITTFGLKPIQPQFRFSPTLGPMCLNSPGVAYFSVVTQFPAVTFSITAGTLPPGMVMVQLAPKGGSIQGTPTSPGSYTFTIQAASGTWSGAKQYTVVVWGISNALTLPDATVGTNYDTVAGSQLTGAGGTAPYTFAVNPADLPAWITGIDPNGTIHGTPGPGDAGVSFVFDVRITDSSP